eukprot:1395461-Alexandrium_andersonii.AAC.1
MWVLAHAPALWSAAGGSERPQGGGEDGSRAPPPCGLAQRTRPGRPRYQHGEARSRLSSAPRAPGPAPTH